MTSDLAFKTTTLENWNDIHQLARHGWIYRGQRVADWPLQTSFDRIADRESLKSDQRVAVEAEFMREFRRSYHQYAAVARQPDTPLEWLSIMQHHGAPTRLLDFTYSIYVAAYFALEYADTACAVWAVNGPWTLQESVRLFRRSSKRKTDIDRMLRMFTENDEPAIRRLFFEPPHVHLVSPVNPFRLNERLRTQKGVFLCPGTPQRPFIDNLAALSDWRNGDHILKIVIPAKLRREAIQHLNTMNINNTSLFPGLDGFARSLGVFHISFNPVNWRPAAPRSPSRRT
jgi:hypothetical protein